MHKALTRGWNNDFFESFPDPLLDEYKFEDIKLPKSVYEIIMDMKDYSYFSRNNRFVQLLDKMLHDQPCTKEGDLLNNGNFNIFLLYKITLQPPVQMVTIHRNMVNNCWDVMPHKTPLADNIMFQDPVRVFTKTKYSHHGK